MTTTRSPATAPIVTLVVSFAIVFGLGQAIGGPGPGSGLPTSNPPTAAPTDPGRPTEPTEPTEPTCVLVDRNSEVVLCPPSGQTKRQPHQHDPYHGQEDQ